jgi:group I intron endonuclease
MTCGIYGIENMARQRLYIGFSNNVERRKREHFNALRLNKHVNSFMQADYNKYGEKKFFFFLVKECHESQLARLEKVYIKMFETRPPLGYNMTDGGDGMQNMDESIRQKLKISNTGKKMSEETRNKLSISHKGLMVGEKNPMFGKHKTDEQRAAIKDRTHRENHPRFGTKKSSSSSQYYGVIFDGRYAGTWVTKFTLDGKKVYVGSSKTEIEAAKKYDKYIIDHNLKNPLNFPEDHN